MNEIEISNWNVFLRNPNINFVISKFQAILVVELHPSHLIKSWSSSIVEWLNLEQGSKSCF